MGCDRFRKQYAAYAARTGVTSGVEHRVGQAIEVDRAGKTIRIVDPVTGDESGACLFVGVLPTGRKQRTRWRTGSTAERRGPTAMSRTRATGVPSRTRTPGPPWICASAPAQSRLCSTHRLLPSTAANQYSTNETDPPGKTVWRQWDRECCEKWARRAGPDCADVVGRLFAAQRFDDQGVEPALAVPRLSRCYTRAASRTRVLAGPAVGDVAAALAHQADT